MKDVETAIGLVGSIKELLANLKEETKEAIINLASESCEVDMSGFHIRQSFSYYDEEVYHIDKAYIDPGKRTVRLQLYEYADSIDLNEFSVEDQIGIYEELAKTFGNSKYQHYINERSASRAVRLFFCRDKKTIWLFKRLYLKAPFF